MFLPLFLIISANFLAYLDAAIMPVSIPAVVNELNISPMTGIWIINAYILTLAALTIISGKYSDLIGYTRAYLIAMIIFGVGSLLGTISFSGMMLIISRVIQAVGGALLIPCTMSYLLDISPKKSIGMLIGLVMSISSIALVVGPVLGGLLTYTVSWRATFGINLPIVAVSLILALIYMPKVPKKEGSIHFVTAIFLGLSMTSIVMMFMQIDFWPRWVILALGLVFLLSFTAFWILNNNEKKTIIPKKLLAIPSFSISCFETFLIGLLIMISSLWTIFLQNVLGYNPLEAGLFGIVSSGAVGILPPFIGMFVDRYGKIIPLLFGTLCLAFCYGWLIIQPKTPSLFFLLPGFFFFGLGVVNILVPIFSEAYKKVPQEMTGVASSIIGTLRESSFAIGLAVLSSIYHTYSQKNSSVGFNAMCYFCLGILALFFFSFLYFNILKPKMRSKKI